jgi:hypothetical protein
MSYLLARGAQASGDYPSMKLGVNVEQLTPFPCDTKRKQTCIWYHIVPR